VKIAFCGASGCGKSTLARYVVETYDLELNPVGSRSVAKDMGFDNPYDVDKADQAAYLQTLETPPSFGRTRLTIGAAALASMCAFGALPSAPTVRPLFQRRLQDAKIAWEVEHESFVTDRSSFDDLAYAMMHCPDVVDSTFVARAFEASKAYDLLIYCPLSSFHDTAGDPARVADPMYHWHYDILLQGLLREAGIETSTRIVEMALSDLDERKKVLGFLIKCAEGEAE